MHRELYDAVTEYVREGYLSARAAGDTARSFLMLLFQRLVASSTGAITAALEKRLENLAASHEDRDAEQLTWDELDDDESSALLAHGGHTSADRADLERLINLAPHAERRDRPQDRALPQAAAGPAARRERPGR